MRGYYKRLERNVPETVLWLWAAKSIGVFPKDIVRLVAQYFCDPVYELLPQELYFWMWYDVENEVYHALCTGQQYVMYLAPRRCWKTTICAGIIATDLWHNKNQGGDIYYYTRGRRVSEAQVNVIRGILPPGTKMRIVSKESINLAGSSRTAFLLPYLPNRFPRLSSSASLIIIDNAEFCSFEAFQRDIPFLCQMLGCQLLICGNPEASEEDCARLNEIQSLCPFQVINHHFP